MDSWKKFKERFCHYLVPPGCGVLTISTASKRNKGLHKIILDKYKVKDITNWWHKSIPNFPPNEKVLMLGIPSDCGGGIIRGANWGPLALREMLYQENDISNFLDIGDVKVIPQLLMDKYLNDETLERCRAELYPNMESLNFPVSPLSIAEDFAQNFYHLCPDKSLFTIGGDHSISYPLVSEYLKAKKRQNKKCAVIHFDAHTDLLEKRYGIDICFATWAYHIIPLLNASDLLVQIGISSSQYPRSHWETRLGVRQFWAKEIAEQGAVVTIKKIVEHLKTSEVEELYVSFDIDAIDAQYCQATGTPEEGGIPPHEAILMLDQLSRNFTITGGDIVEIAPNVTHQESKNITKNSEPLSTLLVSSSIASHILSYMNKSR